MLVSIVSGIRYIFGAISTKLYYNIELWLTLPGAAAFYGFVSLAGYIKYNFSKKKKKYLYSFKIYLINENFFVDLS